MDDQDDALALLGESCVVDGHSVVTVSSGNAALEQAPKFRPQVAIIALRLADMDGCEVAQQLRAMFGVLCPTMTALSSRMNERERAVAAMFDAFVLKPVDLDTISRLIATS